MALAHTARSEVSPHLAGMTVKHDNQHLPEIACHTHIDCSTFRSNYPVWDGILEDHGIAIDSGFQNLKDLTSNYLQVAFLL